MPNRWGWGQPGARQNITESGRIAELKVRIYITLVLILCSELLIGSILGIGYFLDWGITTYFLNHLDHLAALAISPIPILIIGLGYVLVRDLFDPNFEPLNAVIERTNPLWPWRGKLKQLIEWMFSLYKRKE